METKKAISVAIKNIAVNVCILFSYKKGKKARTRRRYIQRSQKRTKEIKRILIKWSIFWFKRTEKNSIKDIVF